MTSPDGADIVPIVDVSATQTKKITLTALKEWFQSLTGWITAIMLATDSVETIKIKDSNVTVPKIYNPYKIKVQKITSNQTLSASYTPAKVTLTSKVFDINNNYNTSTSEYTAPVTGYYWCSGSARFQNGASAGECGLSIFGATVGDFRTPIAGNEYMTLKCSGLAYITAGTKVYLTAYSQNGGTLFKDFPDQTYMSIHLISV